METVAASSQEQAFPCLAAAITWTAWLLGDSTQFTVRLNHSLFWGVTEDMVPFILPGLLAGWP